MVTRSQYSFCVPIPKKQWTKNLSKYFLVIFRNSTGFYFCWCFFNVPPSPPIKKTCKLQSPKMTLRSVPKKSNTFPRFLGSSCAATCCSVHSAGNCRPPLGYFSLKTRRIFRTSTSHVWKKLGVSIPQGNLRSPEDYMGFRVWPFWMGWNNKKIPTEKTEFHSTAHVIVFLELSKLSDIFLCHEKKRQRTFRRILVV